MRELRRLAFVLLTSGLLACAAAVEASGQAPGLVRVTFVGDSVPASLDYVTSARNELERGLDVHLDLRVCRRLATPSCPYQGVTPSTALESVEAAGRSLGDVLIVDVGYNESAGTYRDGMEKVIRAAKADGVKGIVWVTLREERDIYHWTNLVIRSEAKRRPIVQVVDWNAYSAGRPWFASDGLHLNSEGADGLASLLRAYVVRAAHAAPRCGAASAGSRTQVCAG